MMITLSRLELAKKRSSKLRRGDQGSSALNEPSREYKQIEHLIDFVVLSSLSLIYLAPQLIMQGRTRSTFVSQLPTLHQPPSYHLSNRRMPSVYF